MPLESGTYVSDLVATNPAGSDEKKFGDDHLRLIKSCVKATLPDGDHAIRDVRAIAISADTTVTVGTHDDAYLSVDTSAGAVTLTVDVSSSRAWAFFYKQTSGSNGITIKRQSDSATMSTLASGLVIVNGTDISVITEPPDGSITSSKFASGAVNTAALANDAVTPAILDDSGSFTVDSLEATTTLTRGGSTIWGDDNFAARIAALTVNASPAGTESVACDDGKRVTLQDVANLAEPAFTSGQTTFVNSGQTTVAHGLSSTPSRIDVYLIATATMTTNGYPQGTILKVSSNSYYDLSLWADGSNVGMTTINSPRVPSKDGTSNDTLCDATEWKAIFMAWK